MFANLSALAVVHAGPYLASFTAPQINWHPSDGLVSGCRTAAFFLGVVWLVWVLGQFAFPKRRNMMMNGGTNPAQFIGAAFVVIVLLDINMVSTIVNWVLQTVWWIGSIFGLGS